MGEYLLRQYMLRELKEETFDKKTIKERNCFLKFIENVFSIKDYGETHKIMRLFGVKLKFPKSL